MRNAAGALDAARELVPLFVAREAASDRQGTLAFENLQSIADAGLLGLNVPAAHGGCGADLALTLEVLRTLASASPSTALMLAMHTSVLAHYLIDPQSVPAAERDGFRQQRAWAWDQAVSGAIFGVANSEAGSGGDLKKSRAEIRDGRLYGEKSFCSMGTTPRWFMAAARDLNGGIGYYLVGNEPSSVSVSQAWDAVGMRSSESVALRFDGAPVMAPLAYPGLIDGPNNRHWSTLAFTAIFVGAAEALQDEIRGRGGVLMAAESVQLHLALQAVRAFVRHCAASQPTPADADYRRLVRDCKLFVSKTLAERAAAIMIASGGSSYRFSAPVSRICRDILAAPAVRPPLSLGFDEVWDELAGASAA